MSRPKATFNAVVFSEFTLNAASIAAATSAEQSVTVAGLRKGYPCIVWPSGGSFEANLNIGQAWCSAKDTLKFRITNPTASPIDPASQTDCVVQF